MKKNKIVVAICCALVLCVGALGLAGCASGPNKDSFVGTWDLTSCESAENTDGAVGLVYTEEDVQNLRDANQEFYISFFDNGLVLFDQLGAISNGKWELNGSELKMTMDMPGLIDPETNEPMHELTMTGKLNGDQLDVENPHDNTIYHFAKADEVKNPYSINDDIVVADENGMSILMETGESMESITVADDDVVTIALNGQGVDQIGDPGFNMVITNNSTSTINVWIPEQVRVGDMSANAYMYITLYPTNTTTTFLQLDYADLGLGEGNTDYSMLTDVSGTIQVDNATTGETLGTYTFEIAE